MTLVIKIPRPILDIKKPKTREVNRDFTLLSGFFHEKEILNIIINPMPAINIIVAVIFLEPNV